MASMVSCVVELFEYIVWLGVHEEIHSEYEYQ